MSLILYVVICVVAWPLDLWRYLVVIGLVGLMANVGGRR